MFSKVLIANRGAIATRIIRTLNRMGIQSVAIYSEADAHSLHVRHADEAYSLGEGAASETYLDTSKIFDIIEKCGAQAIHPGYGFLSENPDFVEQCEARGITFIGPNAEHMRAFGLKHKARQLAQDNNVPLLPGTELLTSLDNALSCANTIGYPVMLKSTAGGGGIGMQVCNSAAELNNAFESIKRLSANNFSNDGVFVEKYIEHARHIEVQMFGDGKGAAVAFGERDCSAQRRHQKVVEETPAPNIPNNIREQLQATAISLLSAVKYRNAGTVEYIYDQQNHQFYFLEVNTRLQVEHGVTEEVYGLDLVEWMLTLAANKLGNIKTLAAQCKPKGHAIQARIYAENPHKNFQPCAGLLSNVEFPNENENLRIDHWIETGLDVPSFFDPMLAKIICKGNTREQAIDNLHQTLAKLKIQGIETNADYIQALLDEKVMREGTITTRYLNAFHYSPNTLDVITGGTMTTLQDFPGRKGYWDVGVPPSGPFDNLSFQIGNRLLGNPSNAAGLEITLQGPTLRFNCATEFCLTGAHFSAQLDETDINFYTVYSVKAGQTLSIGKPLGAGARAYLAIAGGLDGNYYLGSRSTFTLGQFGGFSGRSLRAGDVLHCAKMPQQTPPTFNPQAIPHINNHWQLHVIYGPHGAPDFFTQNDIETFFNSEWEVHYNSSRTGVRLIGPKPEWARETGGEAGMHPSNIHDNAYAIGTVDFTGDMPVILGPDGPSLGGFVCPATVITADLWKLGQLKAGDKISFVPVSLDTAQQLELAQQTHITDFTASTPFTPQPLNLRTASPIVHSIKNDIDIVYRTAGDKYLLIEFGPLELDISLRFRVHALMLRLQELNHPHILELTPGIRSLQIYYDSLRLPLADLLTLLEQTENELKGIENEAIPARIIHIPLSWNDDACQLAVEKYQQSVRKDAPWCPDNIEFIRRINGLNSIEDVKKIVFDASYVVMGLGDVYLGAPVATPLDPRHRLVTTKYNPARTWTAENSVGIGGAYMCVYGMEGPGGYQFVGRTLQMWNKTHQTTEFEKPWLLRFFDQIRFYEVSAQELLDIREKFPRGDYPIKIEQTHFKLSDYQQYLADNQNTIDNFSCQRQKSFDEELQRWIESGQMNFRSEAADTAQDTTDIVADNCTAIESHIAGSVWQWCAEEGQTVKAGQVLCILESMKMEIEIVSPCSGTLLSQKRLQGQHVQAGNILGIIEHD